MKRVSTIILLFISFAVFCQTGNDEITGGVIIHTRSGFIGGFNLKYSKRMSKNWMNYYSFEIANIRSPKEIRIPTQAQGTFILGKSNFLFSIRPQVGLERVLFEKDPDQGVKVSFSGAVGPSLGIIKPYIVKYRKPDNSISNEQYSEDIDLTSIVGNGGWYRGIGKSKLTFGGNIKTSLIFDYSTVKKRISTIEAGFLYEQFGSQIELNPYVNGESSFLVAFVTLSFGKKL